MSTEMIIDTEYNGYVFVGWAAGRFQADRGEMMPYANMFVLPTNLRITRRRG